MLKLHDFGGLIVFVASFARSSSASRSSSVETQISAIDLESTRFNSPPCFRRRFSGIYENATHCLGRSGKKCPPGQCWAFSASTSQISLMDNNIAYNI